MEKREHDLILRVLKSNVLLKRLYDEHLALEKKLDEYGRRIYLTAAEELEAKNLKKKKLRGVDKMMQEISKHTSGNHVTESEALQNEIEGIAA